MPVFTEAASSSGALVPWVWGEADDDDTSDMRLATRGSQIRARTSLSTRASSSLGSPASRGGLSSSGPPTTSQSLGVEGARVSPHHKLRKRWMKNPNAECAASTPPPQGVPARALSPTSPTPPVVSKLDLMRKKKTHEQVKPGEVRLSPGRPAPRVDVQPYLGPVLKKALAKQGMRMQRLDLGADEWDTAEVRFMLGAEYVDKEDERRAKHLDWYMRKMGPKFVKRMAMDKGGGRGLHSASTEPSPAHRRVTDVCELLRGRLSSVAIVDTTRVLDFDHLATGVEAFRETLPGLHHSTTGVYSEWDHKEISIGDLVRARLPSRETMRKHIVIKGKAGDYQEDALAPLLVHDKEQRLSKKSRFLDRTLGHLKLGRAGLQDRAFNEATDEGGDEAFDASMPSHVSAHTLRAPFGTPQSYSTGHTSRPPSRPLTMGRPNTSTIDTSDDPGRGGFLTQELRMEVRGDPSYEDAEEPSEDFLSVEADRPQSAHAAPWELLRTAPACSF